MIRLEPIDTSDEQDVEYLYDISFGRGRFGLSAYRLRKNCKDVRKLAIKAIDHSGIICGAIRFWQIRIGNNPHAHLLLGPIAVHPTRQGEGIGSMLITEGIIQAGHLGYRLIILVGDLDYYSRFGFKRNHAIDMPPPTNPDRILSLELTDGSATGLSGKVTAFH